MSSLPFLNTRVITSNLLILKLIYLMLITAICPSQPLHEKPLMQPLVYLASLFRC